MKFRYQYRTRDNVVCLGEISAADRESAFGLLKAQGIRPAKIEEASGIVNKVVGRGKRWLLVSVLAMALMASLSYLLRMRSVISQEAVVDRCQIYGDPSFLQKCVQNSWTNVFEDAGECLLAKFAQPGDLRMLEGAKIHAVVMLEGMREGSIKLRQDDRIEVRTIKRIVNGMKDELSLYVASGGSFSGYVDRLYERQSYEAKILESKLSELESIRLGLCEGNKSESIKKWVQINEELRDFGLSTVEIPSERLNCRWRK